MWPPVVQSLLSIECMPALALTPGPRVMSLRVAPSGLISTGSLAGLPGDARRPRERYRRDERSAQCGARLGHARFDGTPASQRSYWDELVALSHVPGEIVSKMSPKPGRIREDSRGRPSTESLLQVIGIQTLVTKSPARSPGYRNCR